MIIAIGGPKGSGKDSLCAALIRVNTEPTVRRAFADPIKRIAMDVFALSHEQCHGDLAIKEKVDERWGVSPRVILQTLGTDIARQIHDEVWIRKTMRDIASDIEMASESVSGAGPALFVIPDARYDNEAQAVRDAGGIVVNIEAPLQGDKDSASHTSERGLDPKLVDVWVDNKKRVKDVNKRMDAVARRILAYVATFNRETATTLRIGPA